MTKCPECNNTMDDWDDCYNCTTCYQVYTSCVICGIIKKSNEMQSDICGHPSCVTKKAERMFK